MDEQYMYTGDVIISHNTQQSFWCKHQIWVDRRYYGWWSDSDIYDFLLSRGLEIPSHFEEWKENQTLDNFWRLPLASI
uniref:Uncharacterized protein n=1 Tax=Marseillevirus LCMAC101 TaxID=2506602 RepID=A0A481YRL3_9VIRU|nr:MAG: hypothetical protein LCMAC101_04270 [Marseillevirus LCMAC101]